jgi:hypothetical protein
MMPLVPFGLSRITDRSVGGDTLLKLGVYRQSGDAAYLLGIDSPRAETTLEQDLAALLEQWVQQLEGLTEGDTTFLPFSFSDQCTAWLRVSSPDGRRALVQAGWSSLEGWKIDPSVYARETLDDFDPIVNAAIECDLSDLITTIRENRDAF